MVILEYQISLLGSVNGTDHTHGAHGAHLGRTLRRPRRRVAGWLPTLMALSLTYWGMRGASIFHVGPTDDWYGPGLWENAHVSSRGYGIQ